MKQVINLEHHPNDSRLKIAKDDIVQTLSSRMGTGGGNVPMFLERHMDVVRRLTPTECSRLQGYPEFTEINIGEMTKDEYIAFNLACGNILADAETGYIYTTRGPGGVELKEPKKLNGTDVKGYKVYSIKNGNIKFQCRGHRIVWISKYGIIPDGYVIDHINNDKADNRLSNLQLLTPEENSHKAKADGLYRSGMDNPASKISEEQRWELVCDYQSGEYTSRALCEKYGISDSRVWQIIKKYGWVDIPETMVNGKLVKPSDSAKYKALGNSIALPQWWWLICNMNLPMGSKLGSLFDGIGGFPLVWETRYGKGTARWASEIEPFPIAVTMHRFPEDDNDFMVGSIKR